MISHTNYSMYERYDHCIFYEYNLTNNWAVFESSLSIPKSRKLSQKGCSTVCSSNAKTNCRKKEDKNFKNVKSLSQAPLWDKDKPLWDTYYVCMSNLF